MSIGAVVVREFRENKLLPPVVLVLGILLTGLPLAWGTTSLGWKDATAIILILAVILSLVLGLLLGAGLMGPDLQEGRAGFFLARPISPLALFAGKLLAAFLLSALCGLMLALPSLLWHGPGGAVGGWVPLGFALVLLGVILLGHTVSLAFRDRSAWLILDGILILNLLGGAWLSLQWLAALNAFDRVPGFLLLVGCGLGVGLLAGALAHAHWGRSDLRQGHRALSLAVALVLAGTGLAVWRWSHAVLVPDLARVRSLYLHDVGQETPWMIVTGNAVQGEPFMMLMNPESRRVQRVGNTDAVICRRGTRAAGLEQRNWPSKPVWGVWVADLGDRDLRMRHTSITIPSGVSNSRLVLDQDGRRLAYIDQERLEVYDLDSEILMFRTLRPGEGAGGWMTTGLFLDPDHLQFFFRPWFEESTIPRIFELDLFHGRWAQTGALETPEKGWVFRGYEPEGGPGSFNPTGTWMTAFARDKGRGISTWTLRDSRTGDINKVLSTLPNPGRAYWTFLPDGKVVGVESEAGGARLRLLDTGGNELWRLALADAPRPHQDVLRPITLHRPVAQGPLQVWIRGREGNLSATVRYDIDLEGRAVVRQTPDPTGPKYHEVPWRKDRTPPPIDSWAARLRQRLDGTLWLVQPDGSLSNVRTGEKVAP